MHTRTLDFGTVLNDRLSPPDQPIAQQGIHKSGYSEARYGGTHRISSATWWIMKPLHDCHSYGYHNNPYGSERHMHKKGLKHLIDCAV
jgi:hypothetical protein